eukprot:7288709-Prymnesium_polylepis.1
MRSLDRAQPRRACHFPLRVLLGGHQHDKAPAHRRARVAPVTASRRIIGHLGGATSPVDPTPRASGGGV